MGSICGLSCLNSLFAMSFLYMWHQGGQAVYGPWETRCSVVGSSAETLAQQGPAFLLFERSHNQELQIVTWNILNVQCKELICQKCCVKQNPSAGVSLWLLVLNPYPSHRFAVISQQWNQSRWSALARGDQPHTHPSPGANGQGGGQWSVCLSSVLDKQYHFCVSCDLERAQQLWPWRSVAQHAMELSGARV